MLYLGSDNRLVHEISRCLIEDVAVRNIMRKVEAGRGQGVMILMLIRCETSSEK